MKSIFNQIYLFYGSTMYFKNNLNWNLFLILIIKKLLYSSSVAIIIVDFFTLKDSIPIFVFEYINPFWVKFCAIHRGQFKFRFFQNIVPVNVQFCECICQKLALALRQMICLKFVCIP